MIPKIIHYCWFGNKSKPDNVLKAIENWRLIMPDYEIREWNEHNFHFNGYTYAREAYELKNYAFVADICRLHALYQEGGIYLDTDINVLKPFDNYLNLNSFLGYENKWIGTGVIGAQAGCKWIKTFLDFYSKRHFVNLMGHPTRTANTKLLTLKVMPHIPEEEKPSIFPIDYFCAKDWNTGKVIITDNTVCIHEYACSWRRKNKTVIDRIKELKKGIYARHLWRWEKAR